jgi:hypothetical protein
MKYLIYLILVIFATGCETTMTKIGYESSEERFQKNVNLQNETFEKKLAELKDPNNTQYYKNLNEYKK